MFDLAQWALDLNIALIIGLPPVCSRRKVMLNTPYLLLTTSVFVFPSSKNMSGNANVFAGLRNVQFLEPLLSW